MEFRDLHVGQTFDFIDEANRLRVSNFDRCEKISPRSYRSLDTGATHRVGTAKCKVFHISER